MGGYLAGVGEWAGELERLHGRFVHRFARTEPRDSALAHMRGLVAPLERKNGWTLAEQAGHAAPGRLHRLLNRIGWDATGFLKKGTRSAGVQRQYSGTAGRTENSEIGVFLAYAAPRGRTLIDRRLHLPTSWTDDRERCRRAGISDEAGFGTTAAMAKAMVRRAIAQKTPFGWVTADAAYGFSKGWRFELEEADVSTSRPPPATTPSSPAGPSTIPFYSVAAPHVRPSPWARHRGLPGAPREEARP